MRYVSLSVLSEDFGKVPVVWFDEQPLPPSLRLKEQTVAQRLTRVGAALHEEPVPLQQTRNISN